MKKVLIIRLEHDGAQHHLPLAYLKGRWEIGEKVRITVERIEKKTLRAK